MCALPCCAVVRRSAAFFTAARASSPYTADARTRRLSDGRYSVESLRLSLSRSFSLPRLASAAAVSGVGERVTLMLQLQLVLAVAATGPFFLARASGSETLEGVAREEKGSGGT